MGKSKSTFIGAILASGAALGWLPAAHARQAAPPPKPPTTGEPTKPLSKRDEQRSAWSQLRRECADAEKNNPQAAITRYQHFWEEHADLDPALGTLVCAIIARTQREGLKDNAKALATCDWALGQYAKNKERVLLIAFKADLLAKMKRTDEVQALLEKNWSLMLISGPVYSGPMVDTYLEAMQKQLKGEEATAMLTQTFRRLPIYLGDESWGAGVVLYPALIDTLSAQRRDDAALSWAKLRFMLCPYTEQAVQRAAASVTQLVSRKSPSVGTTSAAVPSPKTPPAPSVAPAAPRVFGQSPPPPAAADPSVPQAAAPVLLPPGFDKRVVAQIRTTPLPAGAIDAEAIRSRLLTLGRKTEQDRIERITLFLVLGEYRSAMDDALLYRKELPSSPNGLKQAARVFKAADLDVTRANAFVEHETTGKGEDLLPAFFREFPKPIESGAPQ